MAHRPSVFISGANRGIGLGLTAKFLARGHIVYAAARNPDGSRELWELERDYGDRCRIVHLDVTDDRSLADAGKKLGDTPLDYLINNAGVMTESGKAFPTLTEAGITKTLAVNAVAPLRVTQALLTNLQAASHPVVATISSKMGSIADNKSGGSYAYRMSKSAVNMFARTFAADYPGIVSVVLHPGWVQTDMGGSGAPTTIEDATEGLVKVISSLSKEASGRFFDFRGAELPW